MAIFFFSCLKFYLNYYLDYKHFKSLYMSFSYYLNQECVFCFSYVIQTAGLI